jgi:hypothetical protein
MAKVAALTIGGRRPSKRSPVGSSAENARRPGTDLGADLVGDDTKDALAVFHRQSLPGVAKASGQAVDPQPAVRIEHDLDDGGIFQPGPDRMPHRRAQHANAARSRF